MSTSDRGKWAEKQARDWMESQSGKDSTFVYHRYPDAKAARGALAKQPSDYLVSAMGSIYHIEVKETQQINRLPKSKIRQYGMLLKWHWGNITPYVVVFRSEVNDWVYLGPDELFCFDDCPPSFDMTSRPRFPTCNELLKELLT